MADTTNRSPFEGLPAMNPWEAAKKIEAAGAKEIEAIRIDGNLQFHRNRKMKRLPKHLEATALTLFDCTKVEKLPETMAVKRLNLNGCPSLSELPAGLHVRELKLDAIPLTRWPDDLHIDQRLTIENCPWLTELPEGIDVLDELVIRGCPNLRSLPANLRVRQRFDLSGCASLETIPESLARVPVLILRDCTGLTRLPENLEVNFLDLGNCLNLEALPENGVIRFGRLDLRNCARIRTLPDWIGHISQLNVSGCPNLFSLPEGLSVSSWIDVGGSSLTGLPQECRGVQLRWRGVRIDERIAFQPETITAAEVLSEQNVELRRVKLERLGYEKFFEETDARVLDCDTDPGGERKLLFVEIEDDEPLVCVSVNCPSTGRNYLIRVPPTMTHCRQAVAWIAGFDNPDDYRPLIET